MTLVQELIVDPTLNESIEISYKSLLFFLLLIKILFKKKLFPVLCYPTIVIMPYSLRGDNWLKNWIDS